MKSNAEDKMRPDMEHLDSHFSNKFLYKVSSVAQASRLVETSVSISHHTSKLNCSFIKRKRKFRTIRISFVDRGV